MVEKNLFVLKAALVMKLSRLGLDTAICHRCGRIFEKAEGRTLCKDCQE